MKSDIKQSIFETLKELGKDGKGVGLKELVKNATCKNPSVKFIEVVKFLKSGVKNGYITVTCTNSGMKYKLKDCAEEKMAKMNEKKKKCQKKSSSKPMKVCKLLKGSSKKPEKPSCKKSSKCAAQKSKCPQQKTTSKCGPKKSPQCKKEKTCG